MSHNILLLPGDGIGPEIMAQAVKVLDELRQHHGFDASWQSALVGGAAIEAEGSPLSEATLNLAKQVDAVLLAAVGGPAWDKLPMPQRPEKGLLTLRSELALFANLRPATLYNHLIHASSLKPELVNDLDILIVRELTGGIYFGEPRGIRELPSGERQGVNTYVYSESEIERIAHVAFTAAMKRNRQLCSVDKANVLEVTVLWREVMTEVAKQYPEVTLSHMYVDNAAMQLVREPKQFDVVVTGNMFGDILSDCAAMLTGSIGMLPSASLDKNNKGLYEPVHGSAPDIAEQDKANPLAMILSLAMMLRYTFNEVDLANKVEVAVDSILQHGYRAADIATEGTKRLGTEAIGDKIVAALREECH